MIASTVAGKYVIRLCITFEHATDDHIGKDLEICNIKYKKWNIVYFLQADNVWALIKQTAESVLRAQTIITYPKPALNMSKNHLTRMSFTRRVSLDVLTLSEVQEELKDDSTPILVLDTDEV